MMILWGRLYYIKSILPKKAVWTFLKEYKVYTKSFFRFVLFTHKRGIEIIVNRMSIPLSEMKIIYGAFIIKHGTKETHVQRGAIALGDAKLNLNLLKTVIGKIENVIFMTHPLTTIYYDVAIENTELSDILISLGYNKSRTYLSNYKVRFAKSKIMN